MASWTWEVVQATHAEGEVLLYVPQPLHTPHPQAVRAPLAVGAQWHVAVPDDWLDLHVWVWWYDQDVLPETRQVVEVREGYAQLKDWDQDGPGHVRRVDVRHQDGSLVNRVVLKCVAGPRLAARKAWAAQGKERGAYTETQQRDVGLVTAHSQVFWSSVAQDVPPRLSRWDSSTKFFPVGPLPPWAFVLEYATVPSPSVPVLLRLVQVAQHRLGLRPGGAAQWPVSTAAEVLNEMCTLLTTVAAYRLDARSCAVDSGGDDEKQQQEPSAPAARCDEDVWTHPLVPAVSLDHAGFDCEDAASLIFYVARCLQSLPAGWRDQVPVGCPPAQVEALDVVATLARRYVFFLALASLRLGPDRYTYHALVVGQDATRAHALLSAKPQPTPAATTPAVPWLWMEGTEYTTGCWSFDGYPQPQLFDKLRLRQPPVTHAKVPAAVMRRGQQYQTVVALEAPHLWQQYHACEWAVEERDGTGGAWQAQGRAHVVQAWDPATLRLTPTTPVTVAQLDGVQAAVGQLPRTPGLPPLDATRPYWLPPAWDPQHALLSTCRPADYQTLGVDVAWRAHARSAGAQLRTATYAILQDATVVEAILSVPTSGIDPHAAPQ